MKDVQIKVWPETVGFLPALTSIKIKKDAHRLHVDFSNCRIVSSTGLTTLLIQVLGAMEGRRSMEWTATYNDQIHDQIARLGWTQALNRYAKASDLFRIEEQARSKVISEDDSCVLTSYPIHVIGYTDFDNRREATDEVIDYISDCLDDYASRFRIHRSGLLTIINELSKNAADHTKEDGFIALDTIEKPETLVINFVFGDMGDGIKAHIGRSSTIRDKRRKKFSLYEAYYYAFKKGITGGDKSINRGLGLSIVSEGAKTIQLALSVFDARSRGLIENLTKYTHSNIRKHLYEITTIHGFFYSGLYSCNKIARQVT